MEKVLPISLKLKFTPNSFALLWVNWLARSAGISWTTCVFSSKRMSSVFLGGFEFVVSLFVVWRLLRRERRRRQRRRVPRRQAETRSVQTAGRQPRQPQPRQPQPRQPQAPAKPPSNRPPSLRASRRRHRKDLQPTAHLKASTSFLVYSKIKVIAGSLTRTVAVGTWSKLRRTFFRVATGLEILAVLESKILTSIEYSTSSKSWDQSRDAQNPPF